MNKQAGFIQNVFPLLTSLLFHAALLTLGLLTYQSVKVLLNHQVQVVVGDTPLISPAITAGLNDGYRGDQHNPVLQPQQEWVDDAKFNGFNTRSKFASFDSNPDAASDPVIGLGLTAGQIGRFQGGNGQDGAMAPFGLHQPGGGSSIFRSGPPGSVRPRSIAFLCDASGSMLPKFSALQRELSKAIQQLQPVQSFTIHFFSDTKSITFSPKLVMATPENKLRALNFIEDVTPRGSTDPTPSLELAFKAKPQLIFLLTDGDFPDNAAVLNRIGQLNRDHRMKINTIAFVGEGDSDTAFIALLQRIARDSGGVYRHVTQDELQ